MGQRQSIEERPEPVRSGIEVLRRDGFRLLQGCKVGVVTNATGVSQELCHVVDLLHEAEGVDLVAVFGPEHGFRGGAQAGSSETTNLDPHTQVPVFDIYMKSGKALAAVLERSKVNTLLFDIQDVGVRFYTYIWTLYDCMVAVAMAKTPIRIVVADRPNPIGGAVVDGPLLQPPYASFVGRKPIALRHGMTVAELAQLFNAEFVPLDSPNHKGVELEVVKMEGWRREQLFCSTGLPWVPPSPNMPTPTTALLYAGMCLFEGTNCSEGRGTTLPFELVGAPWMDFRFALEARREECPGVIFREAHFTPSFSKFSGQSVCGLQVHLTDSMVLNPLRVALTLLHIIRRLYPTHFQWRKDGGSFWVDKLTGSSVVREAFEDGRNVDEIMATWQDDILWFATLRHRFLLYPSPTSFARG